jgi:hypothetical protein
MGRLPQCLLVRRLGPLPSSADRATPTMDHTSVLSDPSLATRGEIQYYSGMVGLSASHGPPKLNPLHVRSMLLIAH